MAKFLYIRPTKLHPEREQRSVLEGIAADEVYVDEKPKRGQPTWYWWDKLIRACRPDEGDEVYVSHAGVIADSVPIAFKRLGDLTARGATLVIASTGNRYRWHPDAAAMAELAVEMEREARREVARRGGEGFARKKAAERRANAAKLREARRQWLDPTILTEDVVRFAGMSRNALYKRYGPRGTPRFGKPEGDDDTE